MTEQPERPEDGGPGALAENGYLTLTGLIVSFVAWMGIGWLIGGPIGMWTGAVLNLLRYGLAIWRSAYAPMPPFITGAPHA